MSLPPNVFNEKKENNVRQTQLCLEIFLKFAVTCAYVFENVKGACVELIIGHWPTSEKM